MHNLKNVMKSLNEIAIRLASNTELQKLLMVDSMKVEDSDFSPLTIQEMLKQHYICLTPQNENAIVKSGRNTFLIITPQEINLADKSTSVSGSIYIVTDLNHATIDNYEDRCLKIADLLLKTLDGLKLTASITLQLSYISRITYTELLTGYSVSFSFTDQKTEGAEI